MYGPPCTGEQDGARNAPRGEITNHLLAWTAGNQAAIRSVFAGLYESLHHLALRALSGERTNHTLGTTGLVSEAFFRMMEQQRVQWRNREHFLAIAAQMMRRILIDHARGRNCRKRGGAADLLPLAFAIELPDDALDELVAIHDALDRLAAIDPAQSEIVQLRFFGGLSHEEIAGYLGVSVPTIERRWRLARAWLFRALEGSAR